MCRSSNDCSNGEKCINKKCVIACTNHNQCQNNEACTNSICMIGCRSSRDCSLTMSCINNKCKGITISIQFFYFSFMTQQFDKSISYDISDPCKAENVCGPNALCSCIDHTTTCSCPMGFQGNPTAQQGCVRVPSSCRIPQDCPSQHACVNGQCQCQCKEHNNCAHGERCNNGICVKVCYGDSNCLPGELCIDGNCETGCTSDGGCNTDEVCINNKCR